MDNTKTTPKAPPPRDGFLGVVDAISDQARELPWGIGVGLANQLDRLTGRNEQ